VYDVQYVQLLLAEQMIAAQGRQRPEQMSSQSAGDVPSLGRDKTQS
jgi:hypothetical protein